MGLSRTEYATARAFYGSDESRPFQLVTYWNVPTIGGGSPADAVNEFVDAFQTQIELPLQNVLCGEAFIYGFTASLNIGGVVYPVSKSLAGVQGTVAGDELPDYAAACIRKLTAHGGRTGFGRWFIGGVPELFTNTSVLTGDGHDAYEVLAVALATLVAAPTYDWIPNHYSHKDDSYYEIERHLVDGNLATQRRRRFRLPV